MKTLTEIDVMPVPSDCKRLENSKKSNTISVYEIKPYVLRRILTVMEMEDLKNLARFLGVKLGKTKKDIARSVWLSGKIERLGFVTTN